VLWFAIHIPADARTSSSTELSSSLKSLLTSARQSGRSSTRSPPLSRHCTEEPCFVEIDNSYLQHSLMPKSHLLNRLRGRRKCKVLVTADWTPSPDFQLLSDKIYDHILRSDRSPSNGLPSVDVRKYLSWWKLRTYGRNVEFAHFPVRSRIGFSSRGCSSQLIQCLCSLLLCQKRRKPLSVSCSRPLEFHIGWRRYAELQVISVEMNNKTSASKHRGIKLATLDRSAFHNLLLMNCKLDPYESLKVCCVVKLLIK
jgi:hypothetical protein